MQDNDDDDREFTDEQLRAALKGMGEDARKEAFAAGLPVVVLKGSAIVALFPDGSEKIIKTLCRKTDVVTETE